MLTAEDKESYRKLMSDSEIEGAIGKILGEYKSMVFHNIVPYDYKDIKFKYTIFDEKGSRQEFVKLDAHRSRTKEIDGVKISDPGYMYWIDILERIFLPIRIYLDEKKEAHRIKMSKVVKVDPRLT